MKKVLFILLAMCALGGAVAQSPRCSIAAKGQLVERALAGDTVFSFIVKMRPGFDYNWFFERGIRFGAQVGDIVTMRVPKRSLYVLDASDDVVYYSLSNRVGRPSMDKTRGDTRTDSVEHGLGLPGGMGYDGSGVYIGITDWGFDYTHPNLNRGDVSNRRIERAWDHFRTAGPPPDPTDLNYGTEIVGYTDLIAARGDTSNLYGYGTHGTHVAGIAAGAGTDEGVFRGQAPGARMLLCSFGLGESEWLDGVAWMHRVAKNDNKRLVVNSSWGMYSFSCIDGRSLLSEAIDRLSDEGVVFVTSAGNNGGTNFHISRNFSEVGDTMRTVASYYTLVEDAIGQCLIMWGEENHSFSARFLFQKDDQVWYGPLVNTADGNLYMTDSIDLGDVRVAYRVTCEQANPLDNRPHIQFDVDRASGKQLQLQIIAENGLVHAWNVANKTNHAGNEGAAFHTGGHPGYVGGDNDYGVGEPGCASKTITVAAHDADTWSSDSSRYNTGSLTSFSSYGPALGEGRKPEISAPGYQVNSSISLWSDTKYTPTATQQVGVRTYRWSPLSGTSMSSPAVTGVVALMLQANPNLTTDEVREILFTTARNDDKTGDIQAGGTSDLRWGWGKVDALAAVKAAVKRVGIEQAESQRLPLFVYPNPTSGLVTVQTGCGELQLVDVFSAEGRRVMSFEASGEHVVDMRGLPQGVYIVKCGSRTAKLVVK